MYGLLQKIKKLNCPL